MEFPADIFKQILTFLKLGEKDKIRLCLLLSDIRLVPRVEVGDIEVNRCAFMMDTSVNRLCALISNGYEEKYTVRVVTKATKCYYYTLKVNMLEYPEIFEPIMDGVTTTEKDALAPHLFDGHKGTVKMVSGWFKVNKALMAFKGGDRCDQREMYVRSNYIQVLHGLKI
jgi:hypothetical protein